MFQLDKEREREKRNLLWSLIHKQIKRQTRKMVDVALALLASVNSDDLVIANYTESLSK